MAIENFKPTLWETALAKNFHENSCVSLITTAPVEKRGDKVVFNRVQNGAWKDYDASRGITWDSVSTTKVEMTFPRQSYYAFMVEDVDACQTATDVLGAVTEEQALCLAEKIDNELINFISENVAEENTIGADSPVTITKLNAWDTLVDLNTMANKKKIPVSGRYFIVSPTFLGALKKDERFKYNYEISSNGMVTGLKVDGNTLIVKASFSDDEILLTHKSATGFGTQLDGHTEAMRLENHFAEGVRGLAKYGYAKLRDTDGAFKAKISIA